MLLFNICGQAGGAQRGRLGRARPPPLFEVIVWRLHFHEFSREKSTEMTNALPNTSVQVKNTYDDAHDKLY